MINPYQVGSAAAVSSPAPQRPSWYALLGMSSAVMIPWPLLAIGVASLGNLFDHGSEITLLFGSGTFLCFVPVLLLLPPGFEEEALALLASGMWILVWLAPLFLRAWWKDTKPVVWALITQAVFSGGQAGLGLLMLIGKSV